jgi:AcrR family transcriptional regulator
VEEAAGRLFSAQGYVATTMQAIADGADVHVQTIYLAYGTKAAVLAAAAARLVAGEEDPDSHPGERAWAREILATADPATKVRLYVRHIRDVTPRVVRLVDMLRANAPGDAEAAAFYTHMEKGRWMGPYALFAPLEEAGILREGLTLTGAADTTYALASPDTFRALVEVRGWDWDQAETWVAATLVNALLHPGPESHERS